MCQHAVMGDGPQGISPDTVEDNTTLEDAIRYAAKTDASKPKLRMSRSNVKTLLGATRRAVSVSFAGAGEIFGQPLKARSHRA